MNLRNGDAQKVDEGRRPNSGSVTACSVSESCLVGFVSPEFSGHGILMLLGILVSSFRYNPDVPFSDATYDRTDREVLRGVAELKVDNENLDESSAPLSLSRSQAIIYLSELRRDFFG